MNDALHRPTLADGTIDDTQDGLDVVVPAHVFAAARDGIGVFFEPISRIDRVAAARDFLDTEKSLKRAATLERYDSLFEKKVLEIGSGFGTNIAVWTRRFHVDGYGVEPSSSVFDEGYGASRALLDENGIDRERIVNALGENLPFPDESFDIVYSANVLEHTNDPERVLHESLRVLRRGGLLHMEMPNHLSYFEGHYMLLQPPLIDKRILPLWVSFFGRDPAFARTLRTQINPLWCRRVLNELSGTYPLDVLSLGEQLFLERLSNAFVFEAAGVSAKLGNLLRLLQRINYKNWIGRTIVALNGYYPIYVTLRRR